MAYNKIYTNLDHNGNKIKGGVIQDYANLAALNAAYPPTVTIAGMQACVADTGYHIHQVIEDPNTPGTFIWNDVHEASSVVTATSTAGFPTTGESGIVYQITADEVIDEVPYPSGTFFSWDSVTNTYAPQAVQPIISLAGALPAAGSVNAKYLYTSGVSNTIGGVTYGSKTIYYANGGIWIPIGPSLDDDFNFEATLNLSANYGLLTLNHNFATFRSTSGLPVALSNAVEVSIWRMDVTPNERVNAWVGNALADSVDVEMSNNPLGDYQFKVSQVA